MLKSIIKYLLFLTALASVLATLGIGAITIRNRSQNLTITPPELETVTLPNRTGLENMALGVLLQLQAEAINTPLSDTPTLVPFTIAPGESLLSIAARLQEQGLISDPQLFRRFLRYNGLDLSIEAGEYNLQANMSMKEIGLALQQAKARELIVTIPEGWRAEQIAARLDEQGIMPGEAFLSVVQTGEGVSHWLLIDRPAGQGYEGYLYPDTYRLPPDATSEDLLKRMLDNLGSKLPADVFDLASKQGLSFYQVLTMAAIVEREAVVADERPLIAGVYLNRLGPESPRNFLEADPTVQYAMGYQPATGQWWKTPVSLEEYSTVDSPYNTYLYPGLPPGPIANPGIASILAVLNPTASNYYYFVCRNPGCQGGDHVFAETYEEHLANVQRYYGN